MPKLPQQTLADVLKDLSARLADPNAATSIYTYKPHAKQVRFHSSKKKGRLYIGGNRAGKTVGGGTEAVYYATGKHPYKEVPRAPTRGRVIAVDIQQGIEKIVRPEVGKWMPPSMLKGGSWEESYDKQLRELTLDNGSTIEFMSYEQEVEKFAGTSRHWEWFDEEPPEAIFNECLLRLVDTDGDYWITMTPVNGMTWTYDRLYLPATENNDPNIDAIEVATDENPHISQQALDVLTAGLTAEEKLARKEGKYVQRGGLIYPMFRDHESVNDSGIVVPSHVIDPIDPSLLGRAQIYASLDHAFRVPTAILWHAVLPSGSVVTFDEHYVSGQTVDYHAAQFHAKNKSIGRTPLVIPADPSVQQHNGATGTSILSEYAMRGVPLTPANNDVDGGINRVAMYMRANRWFVTSNCKWTIWELKRYRWKPQATTKTAQMNNLPTQPVKKDDHACDALRYFFMFRLPPLEQKDIYESLNAEARAIIGDVSTPVMPEYHDDELMFDTLESQWVESAPTQWDEVQDEYMGTNW
jgi:phage terminase large subunit-like protein